jgi:hypothetical protein
VQSDGAIPPPVEGGSVQEGSVVGVGGNGGVGGGGGGSGGCGLFVSSPRDLVLTTFIVSPPLIVALLTSEVT